MHSSLFDLASYLKQEAQVKSNNWNPLSRDKGPREPFCLRDTGNGRTEENRFWEFPDVPFVSWESLSWSLACPRGPRCGRDRREVPITLRPLTLMPASYKRIWKARKNGSKHLSGLQAALAGLEGCRVIGIVLVLTGVKQEANAQAQWPTSTSAHRSPSPCAWAGSQEILHRTSITIDQQAQGTLPWGTRWSHFITWHESCHLLLFSRVRTLLFSHEKARVTWGRFLHWSSWPAPLCHPILCVPSRDDGHRFHCNEYTVSELVRRIFFF